MITAEVQEDKFNYARLGKPGTPHPLELHDSGCEAGVIFRVREQVHREDGLSAHTMLSCSPISSIPPLSLLSLLLHFFTEL